VHAASAFYYSNIKSKVHPAATCSTQSADDQSSLANKITAADKGAEIANKNIATLSAHKEKRKIAYWRFRAQMNKIKVNGARGGVWLEREA
jgi:hypothetical protein